MFFNQLDYHIRCEWGEQGVLALSPISDAIIIVDVLSFTTCVEIATANGATVYPYRNSDIPPQIFAEQNNAILATRTRDTNGFSLAPSSLQHIPPETRLVLPSPNGSTLSLSTGNTPTYAGCLRNAKAVAAAAKQHGSRISVIPAGERWKSDYSLRPSLEDMLGAGAIIHELDGNKSPEAMWAEMTFLHFRDSLQKTLNTIGSGNELIERGFTEDVELAAQYNCSQNAPRLMDGAYRS